MIGRILRNFRIVSEIGEGGMGVVYLAEHLGLPKRFAIKSLHKALSGDPSFRKRFYEEAQKQALLDDPNIVQVTDFFEEEGQFFLVMEYVDGQDLSRVIKSRGRLPESEVVAIFRDVLKGLGFAHAKGVVHRDMKPSNVLIDKGDRARIMDFGIAIMAGGGGKGLTAAGGAIGSPWYMSPEQIERPQDVDQRSDIYALGIVLYEMLTGDVPFEGETDFSVQYQQVKSPAPDPREKNSEISAAMAQVVLKAMAKAPAERFQDCGEFLRALDAIEKRKGERWSRAVIGALAALIVASTATTIYLYTRPADVNEGQSVEVERKRADVERKSAELERKSADVEQKKADVEQKKADVEQKKADVEQKKADVEQKKADVEQKKADVEQKKADVERKSADVQRRSAYDAIQSGSERVSVMCTQFVQVKKKELGLQVAKGLKDKDAKLLGDRVEEQIRDHRMNIDNALTQYTGLLGQLAKAEAPIVVEAFGEYIKFLEKRESFQQIQMAQLMKSHYERRRRENKSVNASMMEGDCESVLGKRT